MRRFAKIWPGALLLWASTACLNVVDVVSPSEVRTGEKFETAVAVRADAAFAGQEERSYFGVLALSLPEWTAVSCASFDGGAAGKLVRLDGVDTGVLGERAGYAWTVLVTRKPFDVSDVANETFDVKLRLAAGPEAGDYRFAFVAAAAPATAEGRPDVADLMWESADVTARTTRRVTFK